MSTQYSWFPALNDGQFQSAFHPMNPSNPMSQHQLQSAYDVSEQALGTDESEQMTSLQNHIANVHSMPESATSNMTGQAPWGKGHASTESANTKAVEVESPASAFAFSAAPPSPNTASVQNTTMPERSAYRHTGECRPWRRLGAYLIDGILMNLLVFAVLSVVLMGAMPALTSGGDPMSVISSVLGVYGVAMGGAVVMMIAIESALLSRFSGTPGKLLLGMRVMPTQSNVMSMKGALGRTVAKYALFAVSSLLPLLGPLALFIVAYGQYNKGQAVLWDKLSHHQVYYISKGS